MQKAVILHRRDIRHFSTHAQNQMSSSYTGAHLCLEQKDISSVGIFFAEAWQY